MDIRSFYKEFEKQVGSIGLETLLAGFSLYLDSEIDVVASLIDIEGSTTDWNQKWVDKEEPLSKLKEQIDRALEVVTKG